MRWNLSLAALAISTFVGLGMYSYITYAYRTIHRLSSEVVALEVVVSEQKQTIAVIESKYKAQITALINLAEANKQLTEDKDRLISKLSEHDLEELSRYKPRLVEKVINNGTAQVFNDFERLSTQ